MPRITELPTAVPLTGDEVLPLVQSGIAKHATTEQLLNLFATLFSGMIENRTVFHYPDDGLSWTLDGGNPIGSVTRIYLNGALQDNDDFTVITSNGTIFAPAYVATSGNSRIDVFWL